MSAPDLLDLDPLTFCHEYVAWYEQILNHACLFGLATIAGMWVLHEVMALC